MKRNKIYTATRTEYTHTRMHPKETDVVCVNIVTDNERERASLSNRRKLDESGRLVIADDKQSLVVLQVFDNCVLFDEKNLQILTRFR